MKEFEIGVVDFLKLHRSGDLYVLSDFYDECCKLLQLDINKSIKNYKQYKSKVYYRLEKLIAKGVIQKNRIGTGFLGKTDFGMTSLNSYSLTKKL